MNIEEIRNGAPSGATHYYLHECGFITYYKISDFGLSLRFSKNNEFEPAHCNILKHPMIKPLY